MTGTHIEQSFKGPDHQPVYDAHIKELDRFERHTIKYALLERILVRLYNRGRYGDFYSMVCSQNSFTYS